MKNNINVQKKENDKEIHICAKEYGQGNGFFCEDSGVYLSKENKND